MIKMVAAVVLLTSAYFVYRLGVKLGRRLRVVPDSTIGALLVAILSAIVYYVVHHLKAVGMW